MPSQRPLPLTVAAVVSAVEGTFLAGYAAYILIQVARLGITGPDPVSNPVSVTLEIVIFAAIGAGLLAAGWGLWNRRRWGRAPAVLGQLLCLVVTVPLAGAVGGVERTIGIVATIAAIAALVCLFVPSTTRALERTAN